MEASYNFFSNTTCPYFPCHKIDRDKFNCMFCFCPLYCMEDCGGNPTYLPSGIKDCSNCPLPHISTIGYDHIVKKLTLKDK